MKRAANVPTVQVAVHGEDGVGKSALVRQLLRLAFATESDPSIEDVFFKLTSVDNEDVRLDILDTSQAFRSEVYAMFDMDFRTRHGFLLVYSVAHRPSFESLHRYYDLILRVRGATKAPMVLVGNKSDLSDKLERAVPPEEGAALAQRWGIPFFETSALSGTNVDECFHQLVREIREQQHLVRVEATESQLTRRGARSSGGCAVS